MAPHASSSLIIVWLRNDLRIKDNPLLVEAARRLRAAGAAGASVLPIYCVDAPALRARATLGRGEAAVELPWPRCSWRRAAWMLECAADLKGRLRESLASDLLVAEGAPEDVVREIARSAGVATTVLVARETASEEAAAERRVARALREVGGALEVLKGSNSLYDEDDVAALFGGGRNPGMPDVFTPFRSKVEARLEVRAPAPEPARGSLPLPARASFAGGRYSLEFFPRCPAEVPSLAALADEGAAQPGARADGDGGPSAFPFRGGETHALRRLSHYLWDTDALSTYFETRNGMLGSEYSSKLAPWLAQGCVSPRSIHAEVRRYEASRVSNKSTYWLVFELIWRDFFRFFQRKHGDAVFRETGTMGAAARLRWRSAGERAEECLRRWTTGTTGLPLVDANMRELNATGFMSNRGRQNVASFLVLDYGVDWRYGAAYFESLLLDYDVYSNWGNWAAAAGLTGGRVNKFNILKQSKDYDADGRYARAWLPELAEVPNEYVHEPARMPLALQERLGVIVGEDYPTRMSAGQLGDARAFGVLGIQQARREPGGKGRGGGGGSSGKGSRKNGSFARRNKQALVPGRH